ncbi:MAG: hypothetical protein ABIQ88_19190 [Chitinophagaceae bacterium]
MTISPKEDDTHLKEDDRLPKVFSLLPKDVDHPPKVFSLLPKIVGHQIGAVFHSINTDMEKNLAQIT